MRIAISLAAGAALLAGCAQVDARTADRNAVTEAKVVGAPEDCVLLRGIRSTRVRDDRTIDFQMINGDVMRNTLPNQCPGLGFDRAFSYNTSLSRLCSVDTITVVESSAAASRGATCGLGKFQKVELPKTR